MQGQIELFDYLNLLEIAETTDKGPKLNKGDAIYKLVLDVIEIGTIDRMWECGELGFGYSAKRINSNCFMTFWEPNINDTVFLNKKKAERKAESLRNTYRVIRTSEMEVVTERNFVEICDDSRICISATVKILKNNAIYFNQWFCYPFYEQYGTGKEAEKRYDEELNKILDGVNEITRSEVKTRVELKDMYLAKTKLWSQYDYAEFNIPVLN